MDLRCSFSKEYLTKGHLGEANLSRVWFRDGDAIDLDLHFGCGVYLYKQKLRSQGTEDKEFRDDEEKYEFSLSNMIDLMGMMTADVTDSTKFGTFSLLLHECNC